MWLHFFNCLWSFAYTKSYDVTYDMAYYIPYDITYDITYSYQLIRIKLHFFNCLWSFAYTKSYDVNLKRKSMEHWKCNYVYNETFWNKSNFGIR